IPELSIIIPHIRLKTQTDSCPRPILSSETIFKTPRVLARGDREKTAQKFNQPVGRPSCCMGQKLV
ncbi:MAG: hypothetical protein RR150_01835, partial [Clostridia bacterium]